MTVIAGNGWRPSKVCAICRQWYGKILSWRGDVAVIRCGSCGLYYVDVMPCERQKEDNRGKRAAELGPAYLREVYQKNSQKWIEYYTGWLRRWEAIAPGRRLLDIGCGAGYLVRAACDRGWDAYGLDLSIDTIEYGKTHLELGARLDNHQLEEIQSPDRFDIVTAFSVLEHVDDPFDFLLQIYGVLKSNGIVVIKTPSQSSLITKLHWSLVRLTGGRQGLDLYNREHIYRFSLDTLSQLLRQAGFHPEAKFNDDQFWITSTRWLFNRTHRVFRSFALRGLHWAGKMLRMENQIVVIARKPQIV